MIPERKEQMTKMRNRLSAELKARTEHLQLNTHLKGVIFPLLRQRMKSMGVRSFFVYGVAQYTAECAEKEGLELLGKPDSNLFNTQLPFLAEGIIAVQYYENQILDGKGGLYQDGEYRMERIHNNVIAGHFVKDFLYQYVEDAMFPDDDDAAYRSTMRQLRRIFQLVDLGQAFQDKWGTFEALKSSKKSMIHISAEAEAYIKTEIIAQYWSAVKKQGMQEDMRIFTENYLRRISITSGALFALMAELVMDLLGYNGRERENIIQFGIHIGMTGQIVNDINDMVPKDYKQSTVSKIPEDAFADIRNNNVTLPLIFHFNAHLNSNMQQLDNRRKKSPDELVKLLQDPVDAARQVAVVMAKQANKLIQGNSETAALLRDMNSITYNNRYFECLDQAFQEKEKQPSERLPTTKTNLLS